MHHIQKHILQVLTYAKRAKFSEMRPPRVDSNVYSYHLKALQREQFVEKTDLGYRLSPNGLAYVDKVSLGNFEQRVQPKIMTILVLKDEKGNVLLHQKRRQPFIDSKLLPSGKIHLDDPSVAVAAERELHEKIGEGASPLIHVGDVYIRGRINGQLVSSIMGHVCTGTLADGTSVYPGNAWYSKVDRQKLKLAPATEQIINATETEKQFFFHEFTIDW